MSCQRRLASIKIIGCVIILYFNDGALIFLHSAVIYLFFKENL